MTTACADWLEAQRRLLKVEVANPLDRLKEMGDDLDSLKKYVKRD